MHCQADFRKLSRFGLGSWEWGLVWEQGYTSSHLRIPLSPTAEAAGIPIVSTGHVFNIPMSTPDQPYINLCLFCPPVGEPGKQRWKNSCAAVLQYYEKMCVYRVIFRQHLTLIMNPV